MERPLRVLFLIESLGRGGAERLLLTTVEKLDRARFNPEVACLRGPHDLVPELDALSTPFHDLRFAGPASMVTTSLRLRALLGRRSIDVLHTHLFFANVVGRLAARRPVRLVSTLHNPDYTYEDNGTLRFKARKLLDRLSRAWTGGMLLAVSDAVRDDFREHFGWSDIQVIYNYMDVEGFRGRLDAIDRTVARTELGVAPTDVVVLHVGRFHRQKGHDVLLRAFADASSVRPELRLVLAGQGALEAEMRELARSLDINERVRFVGSVPDPARLYACADIFAFPSRFEAFGLALLEAMAAGLPIIATDAGGIPEVTGTAARLVPIDDEGALAQELEVLAADPALRRREGSIAAARAEEFDAARWIDRLEAVYAAS